VEGYCRANNISRLDLIKLDVDGFESEVIAGGVDTFQRNRPMICMELAPYVLEERGSSLGMLTSEYDVKQMFFERIIYGR
jgi:hypothetical protein